MSGGESTEGRTIHVEGQRKTLTDNLWHALRHLRYQDRNRVLWVDDLCIDQSNDKERSEQVSLMHAIYSRAGFVEIWLGESFDDVELAVQFFEDFASYTPEQEIARLYVSLDIMGDDFDEDALDSDALESLYTMAAIGQVMQAAWWYRIWTVQEFLLAKRSRFHCGTLSLDSAILFQCAWHLQRHEKSECTCNLPLDWSLQLEDHFDPVYELMRLKSYQLSFLESVGELRSRHASDPRDRIYGLLGLPGHNNLSLVQPDYSISVEAVYARFVVSLLENTRDLDILSHIESDRLDRVSLPSFVPDWNVGRDEGRRRPSLLRLYNACSGSKVDFKANPGVLLIRGRLYDSVREVVSGALDDVSTGMIDPRVLDELLELADISFRDSERSRERFWIMMCAGNMRTDEDPSARSDETQGLEPISVFYKRITSLSRERCENFEQFLKSVADGSWESYVQGLKDLGDRRMHDAVSSANDGRKGMFTRRGNMGLVPIEARIGDVVAVLTGGRVPIILRPEAGHYTVVGDAYLDGIMDGEAMQDDTELEWIEIH